MSESKERRRLAPPEEKKPRQKRSDAGITLVNERDVRLLQWIGDQFVVRLDQVETLLGRNIVRPDLAKQQGRAHAYGVLRRWQTLGLVKAERKIGNQPLYIWLTAKGIAELALPYRYLEPAIGKLNHCYWVNQVRLYVERLYPTQILWRSERQLRGQLDDRRRGLPHPVDAEVLSGEQLSERMAIEVELTPKTDLRTEQIVQGLAETYPKVRYFVTTQTRGVVERAIQKLPPHQHAQFQVINLEKAG